MNVRALLAGWTLLAAVGCGSGPDSNRVTRDLSDCANDALLEFFATAVLLENVVEEAQGFERSSVTLTPTGAANEFDFVATFDLDADDTPETQITGVVAFTSAPESLGIGDTISFTYTQVSSVAAATTALVQFEFAGGGDLAVSGEATVDGDLGCETELTFDALLPLLVESQLGARLAGLRSAEFLVFRLRGTARAFVSRGRETLDTTATFDGSNVVPFRATSLNGEDFTATATVTYPTSEEFARVRECASAGVAAVEHIVGLVDDLTLAARVGAPTINGESYTFTAVPGAANTFDFSLRDDEATFSGRIAYPGDPVGNLVTGEVVVSDWVSSSIGLAGIGPVEARALAPLVVTFDEGDPTAFAGTTTVINPIPNCVVSVTIPPAAPLTGDSGTVRIVVTAATNSFGATLHVQPDIVVVTDSLFDELEVPGVLISEFLEFLVR